MGHKNVTDCVKDNTGWLLCEKMKLGVRWVIGSLRDGWQAIILGIVKCVLFPTFYCGQLTDHELKCKIYFLQINVVVYHSYLANVSYELTMLTMG